VPGAGATSAELLDFMETTFGGIESWYGDASLEFYAPYYYQSATQLGAPAYPEAHLADLLGGPSVDLPEIYPPGGVAKPWDAHAMEDVDAWVRAGGTRFLFVYGEYDPWSAGKFTVRVGRDAYVLVAPGANHGASLRALEAGDAALATARLREWAGLPPVAPAAARAGPVDPTVLLERWPARAR
jgi:hypothetical protein